VGTGNPEETDVGTKLALGRLALAKLGGLDRGRGAAVIEYGLVIALVVTFCLLITLAPSAYRHPGCYVPNGCTPP